MKSLLIALVSLMLAAPAIAETVAEKLVASTMIMYRQTLDGGMRATCTATIYEKVDYEDDGPGYFLATGSHCVAGIDSRTGSTKSRGENLFVTFDIPGVARTYYPGHVEGYGDLSRGDDFAVLHVSTTEDWPVMPLGDMSKIKAGEEVLNVAAPLGLGLQVFRGSVSLVNLDRPVRQVGVNWQHAMLVQLPVAGGSSGSAVVSEKQKAIVGFVVGTIGDNPSTVVLPVSRFKAWVRRVSGQMAGGK